MNNEVRNEVVSVEIEELEAKVAPTASSTFLD